MEKDQKILAQKDELIKSLMLELEREKEKNADLSNEISNQKIVINSKDLDIKKYISENNEIKSDHKKIEYELMKSKKKLKKTEKKLEITELKLAITESQKDGLVKYVLENNLLLREKINDIFGKSSEKYKTVLKTCKDDQDKQNVKSADTNRKSKEKPGRKKGTQNFKNWEKGSYEEVDEKPNDIPLEAENPSTHEMGTFLNLRSYEKIYVPKQRIIKKTCYIAVYQERSGLTFEIDLGPKDAFNMAACTPSLASMLIYYKFGLFLPNDRIEKLFATNGTPISKQLQLSYLSKSSKLLEPVFNRLYDLVLKSNILHCDETTFLNLENQSNEKNYFWLIATGKFEKIRAALYFYSDNRKYENASTILKDFKGTIISDAYGAYFNRENNNNSMCWAHVRRRFTKFMLASSSPESKEYKEIKELCEIVNKMFEYEASFEKNMLLPDEILKQRNKHLLPLVDSFFEKAKKYKTDENTIKNEAINYALNGEEYLRTFLKDGKISISNNLAENYMRKVAKIRDNSLFSATTDGANEAGILLSIVYTAILNLVNPERYLEYYFENYKNISPENIDNFLPTSKDMPSEIYYSKEEIKDAIENVKKSGSDA